MKTALILEDHPEAQKVLKAVLEEALKGIEVSLASTIGEAQALIENHQYDFALLDISLPDGSGVEFITQIKDRYPNTQIVMATIYADDKHLFAALRNGAQGYLLKEQPRAELVKAVNGAISGQPPLTPSIAQRILSEFSLPSDENPIDLTPREQAVLSLLAKGIRRKEIANYLGISVHTVSDYLKSVYAKLGVHSSVEASMEASRLGLLRP